MTEEEALAIAREAMAQAMTIHQDQEAVMKHIDHQCTNDRRVMQAFIVVGHMTVLGSISNKH